MPDFSSLSPPRVFQEVERQRPKGFLQKLFESINLPGSAVRNLLTGRLASLGRNVADLATLLSGLRMVPGLYERLELSRDEDRPSWGFLGDLVTDPFVYVGLGGVGTAKSLLAAGGKEAARRAALKTAAKSVGSVATSGPLQKAAFREVLERVLPRAASHDIKAQAKSLIPKIRASKTGSRLSPEVQEILATRIVKDEWGRKILAGAKEAADIPLGKISRRFAGAGIAPAEKFLDKGGIKLGLLPGLLTRGKTVALPGQDPLKYLPPLAPFYADTALGRTVVGKKAQAAVDLIKRKLWPVSRTSPVEQVIARQHVNRAASSVGEVQARVSEIFAGFTDDMLNDLGKARGGYDPAAGRAFSWKDLQAKYPDTAIQARFKQANDAMTDVFRRRALREKDLGAPGFSAMDTEEILKKASTYIPKQFKSDVSRRLADLQAAEAPEEILRHPLGFRAASTKLKYQEKSKYADFTTFAAAHPDKVETNAAKLFAFRLLGSLRQEAAMLLHRRIRSSAGTVASGGSKRALRAEGFDKWLADNAPRRISARYGVTSSGRKERWGSIVNDETVLYRAVKRALNAPSPGKYVVDVPNKAVPDLTIRVLSKLGKTRKTYKIPIVKSPGMLIADVPLRMTPEARDLAMTWLQKTALRQNRTLTAGPTIQRAKFAAQAALSKGPLGPGMGSPALRDWVSRQGAGSLPPRGPISSVLEKWNRNLFKALVTVGVGPFVNVAFNTRNVTSALAQSLTEPRAGFKGGIRAIGAVLDGLLRKMTGGLRKGAPVERLLQGEGKSLKFGNWTGEQVTKLLSDLDVAGSAYTATEHMTGGLKPLTTAQKVWNVSGDVGRGVETRLRTGLFTSLLEEGVEPSAAAQIVKRAFIDYRQTSQTERLIRDVFPFAKFTLEQTPRTLEAVARTPGITQPFRALTGHREGQTVPPWLEGQPTMQIGETPEGPQVLGSFGTIFEDLNKLGSGHGISRTLEQSVAGSMTPPLKLLYMGLTGQDPFSGRKLHELRTPSKAVQALPEPLRQALGVVERELPTGETYQRAPAWLQVFTANIPLSRQLTALGTMLDTKSSLLSRSINLLTGGRVYDVKRDVELKRRVRDYLMEKVRKGEVGLLQRFFATGDTDPELSRVIKAYYQVGKTPRSTAK